VVNVIATDVAVDVATVKVGHHVGLSYRVVAAALLFSNFFIPGFAVRVCFRYFLHGLAVVGDVDHLYPVDLLIIEHSELDVAQIWV